MNCPQYRFCGGRVGQLLLKGDVLPDAQVVVGGYSRTRSPRAIILAVEDWETFDLSGDGIDPILGSATNPVVRAGTKNLIEAPEKSFKTTAMMRLAIGIAAAETVFPSLSVPRARKVLYLHGELSPAEIKEMTISAKQGIVVPKKKFLEGRDLTAHLITKEGQEAIEKIVQDYRPEVVFLDPWQSFIAGFDENSFKDVSTATRFIDQMIEKYEITVFIPIHLGKDHSRGARGHSTLAGWRDTLFRLKPNTNNLAITVHVEPRWATPPEPFVLKFRDGTVWENGKAPNHNQTTGRTGQIIEFLKSKGGRATKREIADHLKIKEEAARAAVRRAEEAGAIKRDKGQVILNSESQQPTKLQDSSAPQDSRTPS